MPVKPIDRLLFAQGGRCFFCERPLSRADASVEHLVARTNGGKDDDQNCVACCKSLNALFGRVSLKEKLRIVLNQKGSFQCPGTVTVSAPEKALAVSKQVAERPLTLEEKLEAVLADLRKRGAAKPKTVEKLKSTMRSTLRNGETDQDLQALVEAMVRAKAISLSENRVVYS